MSRENMDQNTLVALEGLSIGFGRVDGESMDWCTHDVSLKLYRGERMGIVGESGSGKSITARSIIGLITVDGSAHTTGSIMYEKYDIGESNECDLMSLRGAKIGLIMQEPMSALHPTICCGEQIAEVLRIHDIGDRSQDRDTVLDLMRRVQLSDVERIYRAYPYQLSGGEQQRICIAMAIAAGPDLLICDEPTTALDRDTEREILSLIHGLSNEMGMAIIFISHDISVVTDLCERLVVMRDGVVVESGTAAEIMQEPAHPYTRALLACQPHVDRRGVMLPTVDEIMEGSYTPTTRPPVEKKSSMSILISHLSKSYTDASAGEPKNVLRGVDLDIYEGEILGVMGTSGSGKSTLAQCIVGLIPYDGGEIYIYDRLISPTAYSHNKKLRQSVQMIFQDPMSSLDPRQTVLDAIAEAVQIVDDVSAAVGRDQASALLAEVGLSTDHAKRYPRSLSGGERQRVCIARALAMRPRVLICDECVSALDVSVQAQILNLLILLRAEYGLTILFISHDQSVVGYLCDRVMVMRDGVLSPIIASS